MTVGPRGPTEDPFSSLHEEPVLDLRAIEARLHLDDPFPDAFKHSKIGQEMQALLVHVRALRAALEPFAAEGRFLDPARPEMQTAYPGNGALKVGALRRAYEVLRGAQDPEG